MASKTVKLNNGRDIPVVGLGTWKAVGVDQVYEAVKVAIDCGYRHIDCAIAYGNEEEVGRALNEAMKEGKVTREELFITGKLWNAYHKRERVELCLNKTLKALGLEYLDLYLMHWPIGYGEGDVLFPRNENGDVIVSDIDYLDAYLGMEDALKSGKVKSIGVSNFNSEQIDRLIKEANIRPVVNQVECHPYLNQKRLIEFCRQRDIVVTAYSPLGSGEATLLDEPKIKEIGKKYNKSSAQVLIRFQVERGVVVIPKSVTKERIKANIDVFDFELRPEEIAIIEGLDRGNEGRFVHLRWNGPIVVGHKYYPFNIPF